VSDEESDPEFKEEEELEKKKALKFYQIDRTAPIGVI